MEEALANEMCKRVGLQLLVGRFILAWCRLRSVLPGNQADMELVAKLIKYVSVHEADLRPQYRNGFRYTDANIQNRMNNDSNFTFLK